MAKAYVKLFGVRLEWSNVSRGVAIGIIMAVMFAIVPAILYLGFLLANWAIFTLFKYDITGWQYIAAVILLSMISSFFKREAE